jgi:uncharacterized protein YndB with AHSA1/START domain
MDEPQPGIERAYRAPVEALWGMWATREGFASWWGPQGFRTRVHTFEARLGGALEYELIAEAPEMIAAMRELGRPASHGARARFAEFEPHSRLAITSVIDFLPGVRPYENTIAVELVPGAAGTRLLVWLQPMHDQQYTELSARGFASQLAKLDAMFVRL